MPVETEFLWAAWAMDNANWLIPMVITVIFSCVNIGMAIINLNTVKDQKRLQQNEFCYQLFEKRLEIYTDMNHVLADIITEGSGKKDYAVSFSRCTRDIPLLFGDEIVKLREEIYDLICQLHRYSILENAASEGRAVPKDHEKNCDKESELLKQISDIQVGLMEYFKPYICFGDFKIESMNGVKK